MDTDDEDWGSELELGRDDAGRLVSAEEFARADYQEPWRYERVRGRLVVTAPDGGNDVNTMSPWLKALILFDIDNHDVIQYVAPYVWVRVDAETDRSADIGIYLAGSGRGKRIPDRVPGLTFEFIRRRRGSRVTYVAEKCSDYERLGVEEYVLVDRFKKHVTVHTRATALTTWSRTSGSATAG
jgi:Uma2 family endonuclease